MSCKLNNCRYFNACNHTQAKNPYSGRVICFRDINTPQLESEIDQDRVSALQDAMYAEVERLSGRA
jgi:hypothetical protein